MGSSQTRRYRRNTLVPALTDEVLAAAQAGDPVACSQIYRDLSPGVLGYLRAKGSDDPEAVTQDVFLAVFSQLNTVSGGSQGLRTFVFSVAHARIVDESRRRARRPAMTEYDPSEDARTSESAEASALAGLGGGRVSQLLQLLSAEQREVLMLRIVADLSIEQVGKIMGKSQGSVKQLQRRALANLKELLEERTPGNDDEPRER